MCVCVSISVCVCVRVHVHMYVRVIVFVFARARRYERTTKDAYLFHNKLVGAWCIGEGLGDISSCVAMCSDQVRETPPSWKDWLCSIVPADSPVGTYCTRCWITGIHIATRPTSSHTPHRL